MAYPVSLYAKCPLLQFFETAHLRPDLQPIVEPFAKLAFQLVEELPLNPELTTAVRKLVEAKDCAVRARLWKDQHLPMEPA